MWEEVSVSLLSFDSVPDGRHWCLLGWCRQNVCVEMKGSGGLFDFLNSCAEMGC